MKTSYRIYFNEKPFVILHVLDDSYDYIKMEKGTMILDRPGLAAIKEAIEKLDGNLAEAVLVMVDNANEAFKLFCSNFKIIQAGGGLVENEKGEWLFIFRRGKWDLPKGKLDEGETIAECALREVGEETGLQNVTMGDHLCNTYHVYHEKGKFLLKESVWYNMRCDSHQELIPQTEEDILEIKWLAPEDWSGILANTFASIKDVLDASGHLKK